MVKITFKFSDKISEIKNGVPIPYIDENGKYILYINIDNEENEKKSNYIIKWVRDFYHLDK